MKGTAILFDVFIKKWRQYPSLDALLCIIAVLVVYLPCINMFFVWDDFIWLDRARTFTENPAQVFNSDGSYFDPLVYLFFWLLYTVGENTPWVYHVACIFIHCVNAVLVGQLCRETGGSHPAALSSALFFATTFAAADAVLWPSSAVDLLAVLFSLLCLIYFTRFSSGENRSHLVLSLFFFGCALASKGTPVVLPAILAFILLNKGQFNIKWATLIPYALFSSAYLLAVRIVTGGSLTGAAGGNNHFNISNFLSGIASLALPERHLAGIKLPVVVAITAAILLAILIFWRGKNASATTVLGISIVVFATLPFLVLKDFNFVTQSMQDKLLLNSASHRLYLATVGTALIAGSAIGWVLKQGVKRCLKVGYVTAAGLVFVLLWNCYEVSNRYGLWKIPAENIRLEVESFVPYYSSLRPNGIIVLAGFSMSQGFFQPMLSTWCGATNMKVLPIHKVPEEIPDDPSLLSHRDNSSLFLRKNNNTINLSTDFRNLLGTALLYQISATSDAKEEASRNYLLQVRRINSLIAGE